jgi:hypothetical protein
VIKQEDGRRDRSQIQARLPLPGPASQKPPPAKTWPSSRAPMASLEQARGIGGLPGGVPGRAGAACLPLPLISCWFVHY